MATAQRTCCPMADLVELQGALEVLSALHKDCKLGVGSAGDLSVDAPSLGRGIARRLRRDGVPYTLAAVGRVVATVLQRFADDGEHPHGMEEAQLRAAATGVAYLAATYADEHAEDPARKLASFAKQLTWLADRVFGGPLGDVQVGVPAAAAECAIGQEPGVASSSPPAGPGSPPRPDTPLEVGAPAADVGDDSPAAAATAAPPMMMMMSPPSPVTLPGPALNPACGTGSSNSPGSVCNTLGPALGRVRHRSSAAAAASAAVTSVVLAPPPYYTGVIARP